MTFEEHYLCHKSVERLEAKFDKMLADLKHGEKIKTKHIDAVRNLLTDKEWLRLKNHLDEDFCRNSGAGVSRYFGFQGIRCETAFWIQVKKKWRGGFGANVKMFGKKWKWAAAHLGVEDEVPKI